MPDRRHIHIMSALIAEDVRQELGGSHTAVGIMSGTLIAQGAFPILIPKLFTRIDFESPHTFDTVLRVALVDERGNRIATHEANAHVAHDQRNVFIAGWSPVALHSVGRYTLVFQVGEQQERELTWFAVGTPPQQQAAARP